MAITRSQSMRRERENQNYESILPKLPTKLIYNILSRLPVKSLLMVKSVSKECYNIIKNPSFIRQHQEYSHLNPNPTFGAILSTVSVSETQNLNFLRVNLFDALDKPIDIEFPFMSGCSEFEILGICNGLVCIIVENNSTDIMICNPLTGEFRQIPDMDKNERNRYFESDSPRPGFFLNAHSIYFGFCMDADKGYELFRIAFGNWSGNWSGEEFSFKGEVYSLTTDTWKEIDVKKGDFDDLEDSLQHGHHIRESVSVFLRGIFYWETSSLDNVYSVLSFNVEKKVLDVLLCPSDCHGSRAWGLQVINEELAVVAYDQEDFTSFSISVLNEQERNWTKKYCVENIGNNVKVLGCARSGQLVIEVDNGETLELFLYDGNTKEEEKLLPYGNHDADGNVFLYTESLVSVNVGDGVAKSDLEHP